jgi:serine/threonine protein kinase/tetratricopeptide (TPR) repeat protein
VKTNGKRACEVCGTALNENSEFCPVCALQGAVSPRTESFSATSSELHFEHYTVLKNEDGAPMELGRGGMGVTYKAIDTHLRCPVALKIISTQLLGNESARSRFLREARAAASVHHPNVATVHHLGESGGNYFYAMEFVDGETLEALLHRRGRLEIELALEIVTQVAAGLTAIHKQHLVHRDIKPSNIMLSWEEGRLENVKIIDLGLAKGVTEDTLSITGSFIGTPTYASPEQFAGLGTDIRSDVYSLGVTLWEMLSGKPPFQGSAAELMDQHQHAAPPLVKLGNIPEPIIALLDVLLAKDPNQRFQNPAQLQKAITKVREATGSGVQLTPDELRAASNQVTDKASKSKARKRTIGWALGAGLGFAVLLAAWFFLAVRPGFMSNERTTEAVPTEKSVAVLPFESLSESKSDAYFADGVQDEILNNLAKIAQLKVISRTSVMQYRTDPKRDLRQIATALGVATVLEGTVRRDGKHVRVSTELVDARNDNTIWADSYDRDLTDIFAIQSDIAQAVASKLSARLSPEEKQDIERKPTDDLEAYDLYLQAKESITKATLLSWYKDPRESLLHAVGFLEEATRKDSKFALAYCLLTKAHDWLYLSDLDKTPERRALGDAAVNQALHASPDLAEVHLAAAFHRFACYRDYERARLQIAIAQRALPNSPDALALTAYLDRRQGRWIESTTGLEKAVILDPRNPEFLSELASNYSSLRRYRDFERTYDRLIELEPDNLLLRLQKAASVLMGNADWTSYRTALERIPSSMRGDLNGVSHQFMDALGTRDWTTAKEVLSRSTNAELYYFNADSTVPLGCLEIYLAYLEGDRPKMEAGFAAAREQLNRKVEAHPEDASLLSALAVIDAALGRKLEAMEEAKRAVAMLPVSEDAVDGPSLLYNLAAVYGMMNERDLAFQELAVSAKIPGGVSYGDLKLDPCWDPLRNDPRFDKLLAELAPRD